MFLLLRWTAKYLQEVPHWPATFTGNKNSCQSCETKPILFLKNLTCKLRNGTSHLPWTVFVLHIAFKNITNSFLSNAAGGTTNSRGVLHWSHLRNSSTLACQPLATWMVVGLWSPHYKSITHLPKLAQIKRGSLNSFAGAKQNALASTHSTLGGGENKQKARLTYWPHALSTL